VDENVALQSRLRSSGLCSARRSDGILVSSHNSVSSANFLPTLCSLPLSDPTTHVTQSRYSERIIHIYVLPDVENFVPQKQPFVLPNETVYLR
jgi:hypothetical protein